MKKCPFCKKEIESNTLVCPLCHTVIAEKVSIKVQDKEIRNQEKTTYTYTRKEAPKQYSQQKPLKWKKDWGKTITIVSVIVFICFIAGKISSSMNNTNSKPATPPLLIPTDFKPMEPVVYQPPTDIQKVSPPQPSVSPVVKVADQPDCSTSPAHLTNGTILKRETDSLNGLGTFRIKNGTDSDVIVKLINTAIDSSVYSVYVTAESNYKIDNISDGNYRLAFKSGNDWDSDSETFLCNVSSQMFDSNFNFITSKDEDGTVYDNFTITLNPVIGGTAKTSKINLSEFNKY